MTVLTSVSPLQWLQLLAALGAFLGPGLALAALLLQVNRRLDRTQQVMVGFALSLSLWAVLFSTMTLFAVALPPWSGWLASGLGWLVYGWSLWRRPNKPLAPLLQAEGRLPSALLWLVVAGTALTSLWALAGVVVQPGSDGYHHTLIAQAIAEQGKLPNAMTPLTSLLTFTYHFGYHVFVALMQWMTGISVVALVPILAQLLKAGAALAVAFLTEAIGERRSGAVAAAAVAGLIAVFPAYYVNWGRNTQITGLVILCVLLGIVWLWCRARPTWPSAALIVLLAVGLAFAHYRVTLMAALGCSVIVLLLGWQARWSWPQWRLRLLHSGVMVGGALLLAAPWLWHVWANRTVGYAADVTTPAASFFELSRLGPTVLNYPTNLPLLLLCLAALVWGLYKRSLGVWTMVIWGLLLYLFSQPWAASEYMDTISVVQSLFVPAAVVIGLSAGLFQQMDVSGRPWRHWLVAGVTVLLSLIGVRSISTIVEAGAAYVLPQDLPAMRWVRENIPNDARFMVNTYAFDFVPDYIIGSDAGGWLPVLAKRRVVTAPMTYPIERNQLADYPQHILELAHLSPDLTTPAALVALHRAGVTHLFAGQRGGPIDVSKLLASPAYQLLYQDGQVYVFALRQEDQQ